MIEQQIRQLQSSDPNERRAAIQALAEGRHPAALRPLAAVYRNDPDLAVRDLALKAGLYIKEHAADDSPSDLDNRWVSERDKQLARGFLSSATDFHMAGDKPRAAENLGKALSLDPSLRGETFVANLIMNVTGMAVAQAVPVLTHPDRRAELIQQMGGKQKLARRQEHGRAAHTATWNNVAVDFAVYWLAATMSVIVIFIFTLSVIQDMFADMDLFTTASAAEDMDLLLEANVIVLLVTAVVFGIYQVVALAIQGGFIHLAATMVLGGDGLLVYLYRRLVPFQTVVSIITAGVLLLIGLAGDIQAMVFVIGMGATVGSLYLFYLISRLVGEVYNFGAWSGCGAIFLGGIIQGVVFYVGNYVILSIIGALLGAAT